MPTIRVEGPPIKDLDVKRVFVKELTDAMVKAFGLRREVMSVVLKENKPENVASGGELILDRLKREREEKT